MDYVKLNPKAKIAYSLPSDRGSAYCAGCSKHYHYPEDQIQNVQIVICKGNHRRRRRCNKISC